MSAITQNKEARKIDFKELGLDILDITLDIFTFWLPKILIILLALVAIGLGVSILSIVIPTALHGGNLFSHSSVEGNW